MKSVLITGATGYIGSNLARTLLKNKYNVHILVRENSNFNLIQDIESRLKLHLYKGNISDIDTIFKNHSIDIVFHLAAFSSIISMGHDIVKLVDANITLGTHILNAMSRHNSRFFINTGSFSQNNETEKYQPDSFYGATKQAFQNILEFYVRSENISATTLKPFDVYGPADPRKKIFFLLNQASTSNTALDLTLGEQILRPIYIDDAINGYIIASKLLFENPTLKNQNNVFYLAGQECTLRSLIQKYFQISGKPIKLNWGALPYRKNQIMKPYLGELLPGWFPKISLDEGLAAIINSKSPNVAEHTTLESK